MSNTVTLSASAKYGYGGKQFVARITGRDSKFTFERQFLGRKEGKRRDYTEAIVDEPGVYEERDIDSKGRAEDSYYLVYELDGNIYKNAIEKSAAMRIAKEIESGKVDFEREGIAARIVFNKSRIKTSEQKGELDTPIVMDANLGSLKQGETVTRGRLIEERRAIIANLERRLNGEPEPVADARAIAIAQIRALMSEHSISTDELA